jgi:hypothetical protein
LGASKQQEQGDRIKFHLSQRRRNFTSASLNASGLASSVAVMPAATSLGFLFGSSREV